MLPLLSLVLAASTPITVAAPELSRVRVEPEVAGFALEHLALRLGTHGVHLVTPKEIATLIGAERQKQLLACEDAEGSGSCVAELGNALGANGVLVGEIGQIGDQLQINVRVVNSQSGALMANVSRRANGENALLEALDSMGDELAAALRGEKAPAEAIASGRPKTLLYVGGGAAAVGAVAGVAGLVVATTAHNSLRQTSGDPLGQQAAIGLKVRGESAQLVEYVGYGLVAAGAATVIISYLVHSDAAQVSFAPTREGAALVFSGSFR